MVRLIENVLCKRGRWSVEWVKLNDANVTFVVLSCTIAPLN